ncbi:hypothetical protein AUP68_03399 [Ilyonectria robusta]
MLQQRIARALRPWKLPVAPLSNTAFSARFKRYQAYEAELDKDALAEARAWYRSFSPAQLPKGNTTYARSSGPGGQHVNNPISNIPNDHSDRDQQVCGGQPIASSFASRHSSQT